jgi:hypothetical protein
VSNYCEWPEFYFEIFPKARKEHKCVECQGKIPVGEKHLHYRGKWDGEITVGRQHMMCRELCMFIRDKMQGGECVPFGGLFDSWDDMYWPPTGERNKPLGDVDKKARSLMAQIQWRIRKTKMNKKNRREAS